MTQHSPPRSRLGDQDSGITFYVQALGPRDPDGNRAPLGEHQAATLPAAVRLLDQLGCFGLVEKWTTRTESREIVARRTDAGEWWALTSTGWEPMPDRPAPAAGPALVLVLAPVPEDVALAAAEKGHLLVAGEPEALSHAERWNCAACGRVVLRSEDSGLYGTAITEPCDQPPEPQEQP